MCEPPAASSHERSNRYELDLFMKNYSESPREAASSDVASRSRGRFASWAAAAAARDPGGEFWFSVRGRFRSEIRRRRSGSGCYRAAAALMFLLPVLMLPAVRPQVNTGQVSLDTEGH